MIEIRHLCKTFHTGGTPVPALTDVSLTVNDGEIFGIIGLSGAGKSTLVRCINLLERPDSGEVIVNGKDLTRLSRRELLQVRQGIGMIFQGYNLLLQRNVLGNVCYPLEIAGWQKEKARARAMELLELVGLAEKAKAYPAQLSGGQKQRVAIARALATSPKVLLCDEATSALDPATTASILALLKEINRRLGVTLVVITHQMSVIDEICDRVAVLDHSRVAEIGNVSEVFAAPQSAIARELILPPSARAAAHPGGTKLRLVFNGALTAEPILSALILECAVPVNILFADTKVFDGKTFGQMLIQLPDEERVLRKVTAWLSARGVEYREEA